MSGPIKFSNNAVATVHHALAPEGTVLTLDSGDGAMFPTLDGGDGAYFKLTLEDRRVKPVQREIVHCVSRSGDTLTIVRGQEGFSPKAFTSGFTAGNRITAASFNLLVSAAYGLGELWLGVHETPPTVGNDGGPIPLGALYFNSTYDQTYTWDGSAWRSMTVPGPSVNQRLFYIATAGQTDFGDQLDIYGNTLALNSIDLQPVYAFINGELQFLDDGTGTKGAYIVDHAANKVIFNVPRTAGEKIELDQAVPKELLAPSATDVKGLRDIDLDPVTGAPGMIDGVRTTFKVRDATNTPLAVTSPYLLQIFLDGVQQRPSTDYTVSADEMIFSEAPPLGTSFWGAFYGIGEGLTGRIPSPTADGQILTVIAGELVWVDELDEGIY